jgi:S1-C subfamily serine protease
VEVADPASLSYRLATTGVGNDVVLSVLRNGRPASIKIHLTPAPETVPRDERKIGGRSPFAGTTVVNMSPAVADEFGVEGSDTGVMVSDVAQNSPARQIGLAPGDIILDVNGESVDSTARMQQLASQNARVWRFTVNRNGQILPTVIGPW